MCLIASGCSLIDAISALTAQLPSVPTVSPVQAYDNKTSIATNNLSRPGVVPSGNKTIVHDISIKPQAKVFKFTLIAGRYWKFILKPNTLASITNNSELRLHRKLSDTSYVIDDDGWFQFNPHLLQLVGWPSLITPSGVYEYCLLPAALDVESETTDSNIVNNEVVASIVVQLIKPIFFQYKDIDKLVDHKFSLDYLHRHASYPVLLNQVIAIFDIIVSQPPLDNNQAQNASSQHTTSSGHRVARRALPGASLAFNSTASAKYAPPTNKLAECLLIDAAPTKDGSLFSFTWSTHPSLINGTIIPILDCRLKTILDTVSKISSLKTGALRTANDASISLQYTIDVKKLNSSSIVPTERGNYSLKLVLNSACKARQYIEELLKLSPSARSDSSTVLDAENSINSVFESENGKENLATPITTTIQPTYSSALYTTALPLDPNSTLLAAPLNVDSGIERNRRPERLGPDFTSESRALLDSRTQILNSSTVLPTTTQFETLYSGQENKTFVFVTEAPKQNRAVPDPVTFAQQSPQTTTDQTYLINQHVSSSPTALPTSTLRVSPQPKSFVSEYLETVTRPPENMSSLAVTIAIVNSTTAAPSINSTYADEDTKVSGSEQKSEKDLTDFLNSVVEDLTLYAVPVAMVVGAVLVLSIMIALLSLCVKKRKASKLRPTSRFDFRYGSERRAFIKNSSKPVILEADKKSLSMGGTPQHRAYRSMTNTPVKHKTGSGDNEVTMPLNKISNSTGSTSDT